MYFHFNLFLREEGERGRMRRRKRRRNYL